MTTSANVTTQSAMVDFDKHIELLKLEMFHHCTHFQPYRICSIRFELRTNKPSGTNKSSCAAGAQLLCYSLVSIPFC